MYSSLEEAFEFCWSSFSDDHNTLPKSTKRNWTNLHLEPDDYQIYDVNIRLRHQYGISVTELQTFPPCDKSLSAKSEEKQLFLQAMDRF